MRLSRLVLAALVLTATTACGERPARLVVWAYLNQPECEGRRPFVLDVAKNITLMDEWVRARGLKSCVVPQSGLDDSSCKATAVGDYCSVTAKGIERPFAVKRTAEGFKVDFRASHGHGPSTLAKMAGGGPGQGHLVRVTARKGAASTGNDPQVILAEDGEKTTAVARVREAARAILTVLADGNAHDVLVVVARSAKAGDIEVVQYVQEGWRQRDDEDSLAARAGFSIIGGAGGAADVEDLAKAMQGDVFSKMIVQMIGTRNAQTRRCIDEGLKRNPKLRGRINVKLTVDPSGKVTSAEDAGSDLNDKATVACVVTAMKSASVPTGNPNGPTTVTVPIDVKGS